MAALEAQNRACVSRTGEEQLNSSIDTWCMRHKVCRNGSTLIEESDSWLVENEFCFANSESDVFPDLNSNFQEFMKAYGFRVSERSFGRLGACHSPILNDSGNNDKNAADRIQARHI